MAYGEQYAAVFDRPAYHAVGEGLARWALAAAPAGALTALDLGCGAGASTHVLAEEGGLGVTGVELSEALLARAARRCAGSRVRLVHGDLRSVEFPRSIDLVTWLFDGVNHLVDPGGLAGVFARVAEALSPGGRLCFDAVTPASMAAADGEVEVVQDDADCLEIHRTSYDHETRVVSLRSDAFLRCGDGGFNRVVERRSERAHTLEEVETALAAAGLVIEAMQGDTAGGPFDPDESPRRLVVCARPD